MTRSTEHEPPPEPARRRRRLIRRGSGSDEARTPASQVSEQERFILDALADLRAMDVREVMTPRVDVVALSIPVHGEDVARAVRESGHSCFPVYLDDPDQLVGVLFVNDLFRTGRRGGGEQLPAPADISRRLRTAYVLPETLGVLDALADMRRQHRGFAVVVDEYGGVAGVLTVKDLLEPLVGELHDEFDADEEPTIVRVDPRRWLVDGRASVDEVRDELGIGLPDGDYVTLGGYLFDGFGHIPREGERLTVGGWQLRVVEMEKRRVAKVVAEHLQPLPSANGVSTRAAATGTNSPPAGDAVAGGGSPTSAADGGGSGPARGRDAGRRITQPSGANASGPTEPG